MAYDKAVRQRYLSLRQGLYERSCEIGSLEQIVSLARRATSASQGAIAVIRRKGRVFGQHWFCTLRT